MNKTLQNNTKKRITGVMLVMVVVAFSILIYRLYEIQIVNGEQYQKSALNNQMTSAIISAERGTIYDRNMNTLAQSEQVYNVCISPADIKDEQELELIANKFSQLLEVDKEKIIKGGSDKKSLYFRVKTKVSGEVGEEITKFAKENDIKGVFLEEDTKRFYPYASLASTVVGFTGTENNGLYGLEAYYNKTLSGKSGRVTTAKNAVGSYMPYNYKQIYEAVPGNSLVLTIDEVIQHFVEKHLEAAVKEYQVQNRAACIVMNVKTGEVLAMATKPDFDPNEPFVIADPQKLAELDKLKSEDEEKYKDEYGKAQFEQWRNKAVSDPYEPGSVFKVIMAASALDKGIVDPYTELFNCPGYHIVADRKVRCWKTSGHGTITFAQAIKYSCNPVFMQIGQRMGGKDFYKYFDAFGLTQPTGIDVPGEADNAGLVHSQKTLDVDKGVELTISSFGQTFKVTPIQLATALCATINGGNLMQPYVIKQELDANGNVVSATEPTVKRQVISKETSDLMRVLLEDVVKDQVSGSGRSVYMPGYRIGGKTGTSEKTDKRVNGQIAYYVSSFMGFAPVEDPEIMVLVLLDEPANGNVFGSVIASPVVGGILADTLPYLGIQPNYSQEEIEKIDLPVPFLIGKKALDAENELTKLGLRYKTIGTGTTVVKQVPSSGQPIPREGTVIVYTEETNDILMVTVPDVINQSGQQANRTIINQGLNIRLVGTSIETPGCVAIKQDPPSGTEVERGSVITVEFTDKNLAG
ncbi:MAG: penicillin-binding transpeptidase domain-containing protein [Oscillospiraceae bacterium]